ncbi:antibiotic biosynthesis monooxygenase family protein [Acidithiobacillus ferriphilus]|uniref:antibiotic biosynthesis monooxygenase family protein n=1 Tax=Acidithiobacillus ferriphilus TaxID=1689834 RepID=UPI00232EEC63|nr:antibiotic biosynthesis monooxygenase [Acidithiobacillus ferriphilus]WCE93250.1 antibiotic biosynthesis monooxygenase [Acidithiobacillus ferriphilus]
MIIRADIISQGNPDQIAERWVAAVRAQAAQPGFLEAKLHGVYRLINKTSYYFLSIIEWTGAEAYARSVGKTDCYAFLDILPADPVANTYTLINSAQHQDNRFSPDHVTVINPYRIPVAEAGKYSDMWNESARHMEEKDGFVSAQLYQAVRESEDFHFVSRAEWQSEQRFMNQFDGADFRKIIAPFEGIFSISLSRLHAHITKDILWIPSH